MQKEYFETPSELKIGRGGYIIHKPTGRPWHRITYESFYGPIPSGWVVHHVDGNKLNNHPSNLISLPDKLHNNIHRLYSLRMLPSRTVLEKAIADWILEEKRTDREILQKQREKDKLLRERQQIIEMNKMRKYPSKKPTHKKLEECYNSDASSEFLKINSHKNLIF